MKKYSCIICALLICSFFLHGCQNGSFQESVSTSEISSVAASSHAENYDFPFDDNIQYIEVNSMSAVEWIQKLSLISPQYNIKETISVFKENVKLEKDKIPVIEAGDGSCFYPGDDETKTSACLFQIEGENRGNMVTLALYDFDQEVIADKTKATEKNNNDDLLTEIQRKNSSGRVNINNYESLSTFLAKASDMTKNDDAETLEKLFGILPKDISDTQQQKFAYYFWSGFSMVMYDIPCSYAELYAPNGSIKIFLY